MKNGISKLGLAGLLGAAAIGSLGLGGCNSYRHNYNQHTSQFKTEYSFDVYKSHCREVESLYPKDIKTISDEEKNWLSKLDKKGLIEDIKHGMSYDKLKFLDSFCDLDNPKDRDFIFLYRALKSAYEDSLQNIIINQP